MEDHHRHLELYCRLCCSLVTPPKDPKKKSRRYIPKPVTKFADIVSIMFKFNCADDDESIHPKLLCEKCYAVLNSWRTKDPKDVPLRLPHAFVPHSDICPICNRLPDTKVKRPHEVELPLNLSKVIKHCRSRHVFVSLECSDRLELVIILFVKGKPLPLQVVVKAEGKWSLEVAGRELNSENCSYLKDCPLVLDDSNYSTFVDTLVESQLCPGNDDFTDIVAKKLDNGKSATIVSPDGTVRSYVESMTFGRGDSSCLSTLRDANCDVLVSSDRCSKCTVYRNSLFAIRSQSSTVTSKYCNDRYMDREALLNKVKALEKEKKTLVQKTLRLQDLIRRDIKKKGVHVESDTSALLTKIVLTEPECPFEVDSPQHLLWEEQKKQASLKDARQMRWHPLMIRWCLSIYLKSPGTYQHMRSTPFISLPSIKTLQKYTNFTDPGCGFNKDIMQRLNDELGLPNIPEHERYVNLCFDEMKIKSGLAYSKVTGQLVGFTDMGDINDELDTFRRCMTGEDTDRDTATHVILFMARGICSNLHYSIGHFATDGFDSVELFPCVWEAAMLLEGLGLRVVSFTSDGATPNRKFYRLNKLATGENDGEVIYWVYNPFTSKKNPTMSKRKIFFISDAPHLVKTTRNNLENSHGNNNTRNLMVRGQQLGWHQILSVYEWDLGIGGDAVGLRFLHKLTEEHIKLTPRSRMRVYLAAQVLSTTMAKCLEMQGKHGTVELRKFISLVDTWFDCLNVQNTFKGQKLRKEALLPYRSVDDWRFKWLLETFLKYLDDWEQEAKAQPNLTDDEKNKLCLSKQTLEGYRITVKSFV